MLVFPHVPLIQWLCAVTMPVLISAIACQSRDIPENDDRDARDRRLQIGEAMKKMDTSMWCNEKEKEHYEPGR